jgi:hypothetical protein
MHKFELIFNICSNAYVYDVKVIKKKGSNLEFNAIILHDIYILKIWIRRMHIGYNK